MLVRLLRVPAWMEDRLGEDALRLIRGGVGDVHRVADVDEWGQSWLEFQAGDGSWHLFQVDPEDLQPV
jgi:hypothetical protein